MTTPSLTKVYLIARIAPEVHLWNRRVCDQLSEHVSVFLPQEHNPWNEPHERFPRRVFEVDFAAMQAADVALLLPEYGSDCAFEVGWFFGQGKPVVAFVDSQTRWLRDWMVKGGISRIATVNADTHKLLTEDPFFDANRLCLLNELRSLGRLLQSEAHNAFPQQSGNRSAA